MTYARHVSTKKVSWRKLGPEDEAQQVYGRLDGLAKIHQIDGEYFGVVPSVNNNLLHFVNIGPFKTLKGARRACETYLHQESFIIYREDALRAKNGNI